MIIIPFLQNNLNDYGISGMLLAFAELASFEKKKKIGFWKLCCQTSEANWTWWRNACLYEMLFIVSDWCQKW